MKTCPLWKFVFSKGHSVSVLSGPRAPLSAVPNWPLVSCSWCEWSSSCICLSPSPPKALVSSEQLWEYFQIKCHLLAPISADKCPQSQVGGRLGPTAQSSTDFWKEQKASSVFILPLFPPNVPCLTVHIEVGKDIQIHTHTNIIDRWYWLCRHHQAALPSTTTETYVPSSSTSGCLFQQTSWPFDSREPVRNHIIVQLSAEGWVELAPALGPKNGKTVTKLTNKGTSLQS